MGRGTERTDISRQRFSPLYGRHPQRRAPNGGLTVPAKMCANACGAFEHVIGGRRLHLHGIIWPATPVKAPAGWTWVRRCETCLLYPHSYAAARAFARAAGVSWGNFNTRTFERLADDHLDLIAAPAIELPPAPAKRGPRVPELIEVFAEAGTPDYRFRVIAGNGATLEISPVRWPTRQSARRAAERHGRALGVWEILDDE